MPVAGALVAAWYVPSYPFSKELHHIFSSASPCQLSIWWDGWGEEGQHFSKTIS
jgi:hypothetical protein